MAGDTAGSLPELAQRAGVCELFHVTRALASSATTRVEAEGGHEQAGAPSTGLGAGRGITGTEPGGVSGGRVPDEADHDADEPPPQRT